MLWCMLCMTTPDISSPTVQIQVSTVWLLFPDYLSIFMTMIKLSSTTVLIQLSCFMYFPSCFGITFNKTNFYKSHFSISPCPPSHNLQKLQNQWFCKFYHSYQMQPNLVFWLPFHGQPGYRNTRRPCNLLFSK